MNLRKKMRRGSLAALITLALTSSALAMPTGGEVVRGVGDITLSGGTWDSVANNATITATNDGQINWQAFNIANGETLNFNIADNKTLINNVTGSQLSDILGTMNQTGGGDVVLVNPNGIHVGRTAVLNVSQATLSALGVQVGDPDIKLQQNGSALVNIDNGATFNFNKLSIFGGKVNVADGVVFNMGAPTLPSNGYANQRTDLTVKALSAATITERNGDTIKEVYTHSAGNDVSFAGTVNLLYARSSQVNIGGAKTTITGASFNDPHKRHTHRNNGLETMIYAASRVIWDESAPAEELDTMEATAGNALTVDGLTATGADLTLVGGTVDLKGVHGGTIEETLGELMIAGVRSHKTHGPQGDDNFMTLTAPDNTVRIASSRFDADKVQVYGGKVTVAENVKFYDGLAYATTPEKRQKYDTREHIFELFAGDKDHVNGKYTTVAGNDVVFHGDINGYGQTRQDPLVLVGSTVNIDRATIRDAKYVNIGAVRELTASEQGYAAKMSAANTLTANDFDDPNVPGGKSGAIFGNVMRATLLGGKVSVGEHAEFIIKSDPVHEAEWMVFAGNEYAEQKNAQYKDLLRTYRGAQGNDVAFHGTVKHEDSDQASFGIFGYTVNADRAKLYGKKTEFSMSALTKADYNQTAPRWQDYWEKGETSAANTVQANGLDIRTKREVYIDGGSVSLRNSNIETGALTLNAYAQERGDGDTDVGNRAHENKMAGVDNVVHLKNVRVTRPSDAEYSTTRIFGGKVNLEDSDVQSQWLTEIYAGSSHDRVYSGRGDQEIKVTVTKENELGLWNSKITAPDFNLGAGKVGVWKESAVTATSALNVNPSAIVTRTDSSTASLLRDASSHVTAAGTESTAFTVKSADQPAPPAPPVPTPQPEQPKPVPTPEPKPTPQPEQPKPVPTPELSKDDKANMASGKQAVEEALSKNATQENRIAAITDVVADLNAKASRRQSAGVVVGIVQEIATSAALSDGEKVSLVERVLSAYAPVQEAKEEQSNRTTSTTDEAVRVAETTVAAPVYPDENEAEDVVTFA